LVESLLDRAVRLLVAPTLDNLGAAEQIFRQAIECMPGQPAEGIRRQVRLCARLVEGAEAGRPGSDALVLYHPRGERLRSSMPRLQLEV